MMEQRNSDVIEIDVKELLLVLRHKLWIILLIGIIGTVGSGAVSKYLVQPIYTSTTKVYVINRQDENKMTLSDLQTGEQLTKDYLILVKSRPVTEKVIRELGLDLTHEELSEKIKVISPEETRILEISVEYQDPYIAKQLADLIASVSSEHMVSVMEIEKVNIVEPGNLPSTPTSPNIAINTILGGGIGVVLVSFLIVLVYIMNDSIRSTEDIEKYLNITTLGIIPLVDGKARKKQNKEPKIKQSRRKKKSAIAS
jgi:capsular polysaccharide biosynthesis protein